MQMDVYDHESYRISISNLMMLKMFHDRGINVKNFSTFIIHTQYNESASYEIFFDGLNQLFESIVHFDFGQIEEFEGLYGTSFTDEGSPEFIYCIHDPVFKKVLSGPHAQVFTDNVESIEFDEMNEGSLNILPDGSGIVYLADYSSFLHELVKGFLHLKDLAIRLNKQHERELKDGVSNQLFNRKSA